MKKFLFTAFFVLFISAVYTPIVHARPMADPNQQAPGQYPHGENDFWYNISGSLVEFQALAVIPPGYGGGAEGVNPGTKYQAIASTHNMLRNPNFEENGNSGVSNGFGNWTSNNWAGRTNFIGASPGDNAPASMSLVLGPHTADPQVLQRVHVEAGAYYYVSAWVYSATETAPRISLSIYSQPGDTQPLALTRVSSFETAVNGEWTQNSFIVMIPPADVLSNYFPDGISGDYAYLCLRFMGVNDGTTAFYITGTEIFQLFPETLREFDGRYEEIPGEIRDPVGDTRPVITDEMVEEVLMGANMDVENFRIVFNLYQAYRGDNYPSVMDTFIIEQVKPYLRAGDILNIVTGNGIPEGANLQPPPNGTARHDVRAPVYRHVDTEIVNERLGRFREALQGIDITYSVYVTGIGHVEQLLSGLSDASREQVKIIFTGYEPNYLLEFAYDIEPSVEYLREVSGIIRAAGFESGAGPSGRGLREPQLFTNWDYGRFAGEMDNIIIQTQGSLTPDAGNRNLDIPNYRNQALAPLKRQIFSSIPDFQVFPQVTIGSDIGNEFASGTQSNPNAAALIYNVKAMEALKAEGFPGVSLWFAPDAMENMLIAVRTIRVANP